MSCVSVTPASIGHHTSSRVVLKVSEGGFGRMRGWRGGRGSMLLHAPL